MFGIETTGASNDIERATDLARKMVMQYGMSDRIGLMALTTKGNDYLDGQSYTDCAQTTAAAADEEVRKLLNDSYDQAKKILTENRGLLDEVALYLLQKETITATSSCSMSMPTSACGGPSRRPCRKRRRKPWIWLPSRNFLHP